MLFIVSRTRKHVQMSKKNIGKPAWRSVRQLKKLQARPRRPTTVISRIGEQCRNSCMYATMHVKKLKRSGAIRRKRLFDALQPAVGYFETLESHVPSRILYISSVRFFVDLFFSLPPLFLSALLACHVSSLHLFSSTGKRYRNTAVLLFSIFIFFSLFNIILNKFLYWFFSQLIDIWEKKSI